MQEGLKNRILGYMKDWYFVDPKRWFTKSEIEYLAKEAGYLGDNATRRLRELAADNLIVKQPHGESLKYQFNP